jgi:hypothetical protein
VSNPNDPLPPPGPNSPTPDAGAGFASGPPGVAPQGSKSSKPWWQRWYVIAGAVLLILIILGAIFGGGSDSDDTTSTSEAAEVTTGGDVTTTPVTTAVAPDTTTTPTEAPTTTVPPTTQPPTTTAPPTTVAPVTYQGSGDFVQPVALPDPTSIAAITHTGSSNFVIQADDANLQNLDLLVNEIGNYQGTVLLPQGTANLEITADGPWTVVVSPAATARSWTSGPIAGRGADVIIYLGDTKPAAITHVGEANFVVQAYPTSGGSSDLLVNEIGPYNGTVVFPGSSLVVIGADGDWTITVT